MQIAKNKARYTRDGIQLDVRRGGNGRLYRADVSGTRRAMMESRSADDPCRSLLKRILAGDEQAAEELLARLDHS